DSGNLGEESRLLKVRLDNAAAREDTTREYVERLETMVDEARLPSGDDLISEIERFLREGGQQQGGRRPNQPRRRAGADLPPSAHELHVAVLAPDAADRRARARRLRGPPPVAGLSHPPANPVPVPELGARRRYRGGDPLAERRRDRHAHDPHRRSGQP